MAISFVGSLPTVGANNGGNVTLTFSNLVDSTGAAATLQQDDVVFCVYASSGTADAAMSTSSSDWTEVHEMYSNGTANDTNLALYYKVMGASPDTSFVGVGPTGNSNGTIGVAFALRGVDASVVDTAFVAGSHAATGTATTRPNPPAVTPTTAGAWILVAGAGSAAAGAVFTNPGDLSATTNHFRSGNHAETLDIAIGVGLKTDWASGAFDPSQFSGGATNAGDSWAALVLSVKPVAAQNLSPSIFNNTNVFNAHTLTQVQTASLFTNTNTFETHTVTTSYTAVPSLFTSSNTFYTPTIIISQFLTPDLFTASNGYFDHTLLNVNTLSPSLFTNDNIFYVPTVIVSQFITPDLFTNDNAFYSFTVDSAGPQELLPDIYQSANTFLTFEIEVAVDTTIKNFAFAVGHPHIRFKRRF